MKVRSPFERVHVDFGRESAAYSSPAATRRYYRRPAHIIFEGSERNIPVLIELYDASISATNEPVIAAVRVSAVGPE